MHAGSRAARNDLVRGHAAVRTSDPEELWRLLRAQPRKEFGRLLDGARSPVAIVLEELIDRHRTDANRILPKALPRKARSNTPRTSPSEDGRALLVSAVQLRTLRGGVPFENWFRAT